MILMKLLPYLAEANQLKTVPHSSMDIETSADGDWLYWSVQRAWPTTDKPANHKLMSHANFISLMATDPYKEMMVSVQGNI